jgi:hypothetical protein
VARVWDAESHEYGLSFVPTVSKEKASTAYCECYGYREMKRGCKKAHDSKAQQLKKK